MLSLAQYDADPSARFADLSPAGQAAYRARADLENFQALCALEPDLTRAQYEARKAGGMRVFRALLGA